MLLTSAQFLPTNPCLFPTGPSPNCQLGLVSLIFSTTSPFKLLTFSLGPDIPDWKTPVSEEALQNPESLQKNLKFLKILLWAHCQHKSPSTMSHCATAHCKYPRRRVTPSEEGTGSCSALPVEVRTQTNQYTWTLTHFFRKRFCSHCTSSTAVAAQRLQVHSSRVPHLSDGLLHHGSGMPDSNTCLNPTPAARTRASPLHWLHTRGFSRGRGVRSVPALRDLWGQTDARAAFSQTWVVAVISSHCNDQRLVWSFTVGSRKASLREEPVSSVAGVLLFL